MRAWWTVTAGGLPAQFWYVWAGTLVNRLGGFLNVFLAVYLTAGLGLSPTFAGGVLALYGVGGAVGVLAGGVLADRWGRRPTLLAAGYATTALMLALGLARQPYAIAALTPLLGFAAEAARPALAAMVVDVVGERDRLRAFSLHYWAINLGFAAAAVLGGTLADVDYFLLFAVDAATTLAATVLIAWKVRESRPAGPAATAGAVAAVTTGAAGAGLGAVFADRVFVAFVACNVLAAVVFFQPGLALPLTMAGDGHSPTTYGLVMGVNGVLIVAGQLFVPRLVGGRDPSRVLALATAVMGLGIGATALADAAWAYAATVVVWTAGEMLNSPSNAALIAQLSPVERRGRYQGVFSLSWQAAAIGGPLVGGFVLQRWPGPPLWIGCLVVTLLVAGAHLASAGSRRRRAAALDPAWTAPRGPEHHDRSRETPEGEPCPAVPRTTTPRT